MELAARMSIVTVVKHAGVCVEHAATNIHNYNVSQISCVYFFLNHWSPIGTPIGGPPSYCKGATIIV